MKIDKIILIAIVILLQVLQASSQSTSTHTAVNRPIQENTNVEQDVLFSNGTDEGKTTTPPLKYKPMKVISNKNETFSEYISYYLRRYQPFGLNFTSNVPTHFSIEHCNKTLLKTNQPIQSTKIVLSHSWIQYFWSLEERCAIKNTVFLLYSDLSTLIGPIRHKKIKVRSFDPDINWVPIEENTTSQEVIVHGNIGDLFEIKMNSMISKALESSLSSQIIFSYASSEVLEFQLAKCGLIFDFTITAQPYTPIVIGEDLLNGFNTLKHIYCSTPSEENLSFQLLANGTTPDVNITMIFHLTTTNPLSTEAYFIVCGGAVALILFIVLIIWWIVRQHRKKMTYHINTRVVYRKRYQITQKKQIKGTATTHRNKINEEVSFL